MALRRPPSELMRLAVRAPLWLYRAGLGGLLRDRFLRLRHRGRRSGKWREVVLEVVGHDEDGTYVVAAAWGERAQWYRNVQHDPNVVVTVGRRTFDTMAERLPENEAFRRLDRYARQHKIAFRELSRLLGTDDVGELARTMPVVAFRPRRAG
jgi:deazaflavin-dependent oxidoreductase (nitroreductase family)